jgi:hypothetical protein
MMLLKIEDLFIQYGLCRVNICSSFPVQETFTLYAKADKSCIMLLDHSLGCSLIQIICEQLT